MMDERELFAAVLPEEFGWDECDLVVLSGAPGAESQTFRVERREAPVAVLHAYRRAWVDWTGERQEWPRRVGACARLLAHLEGWGYAVPRVVRTRRGEDFALRDGWAVLLTGYVGGEAHDYSAAGLRALGEALGELHALPIGEVGESWWALGTVVPRVAGRLAEIDAKVPPEWREWHEACLRELAAWTGRVGLPGAIIHADAWAGNAVIGGDGRATLIDWELAGTGPAVLDFGSLVLHGHYDLPGCLPDAGRIAALVGGYCRHRRVTDEELAVLTEAIRFGLVFRSALFFVASADGMWGERPRRQIEIERERYPAGPTLAAATLDYLAGER
jgi:Ser/Thr protein kinase RdoA (MazF antagonist)